MIIQPILSVLVLALALYFLQNRNTVRLKAGKKVLFAVFVIFAIATILRPNLLTDIAHAVGVGRGDDLLLYGLVVAFVFVVMNIYLKFKDYEQRLNKLARKVAIAEAREQQANRKD